MSVFGCPAVSFQASQAMVMGSGDEDPGPNPPHPLSSECTWLLASLASTPRGQRLCVFCYFLFLDLRTIQRTTVVLQSLNHVQLICDPMDCGPGFPEEPSGLQSIGSQRVRQHRSDLIGKHGLWPDRLLCLCDFPDKNTGVGCHFLLQGIFLTQGLNLHRLN